MYINKNVINFGQNSKKKLFKALITVSDTRGTKKIECLEWKLGQDGCAREEEKDKIEIKWMRATWLIRI